MYPPMYPPKGEISVKKVASESRKKNIAARKMPISEIEGGTHRLMLSHPHYSDTGIVQTYYEYNLNLIGKDRFIMFEKLIKFKCYIIKKVGKIVRDGDFPCFPVVLKDSSGNVMNCSCTISNPDKDTVRKLRPRVWKLRRISRRHFIGENKIFLVTLLTAFVSASFIVLTFFKQP